MVKLNEKEEKARKKVCLPLDELETLDDIKEIVKELSPYVGLFKVGKESFTRFGPEAVNLIQDSGANVFLDLKYHDIPNTVRGAAQAATKLGVYMFNVHASGGLKMMQAARLGVEQGVEKYGTKAPKITAVTVLTSLDEATYLQVFPPTNPNLKKVNFTKYIDMKKDDEALQEAFRELLDAHGLTGIVQNQVLHLAKLANEAKLDGIVCSAADLGGALCYSLPEGFMKVTPGIKGPNTPAGEDQKRVFTPGNAVEDGASLLVIGRAITKAEDKPKAAYEVLQDIAEKF